MFSAFDKAKLFADILSGSFNFHDSGISWYAFPSRNYLKLHNIPVTPKMVKKVVADLDPSETPGPESIWVVVIKNCEPQLSYTLTDVSNIFLKELHFSHSWKMSSMVLVISNVLGGLRTKNYRSIFVISVVSKVFEYCKIMVTWRNTTFFWIFMMI